MHKSIFGDITGIADLSKALIENMFGSHHFGIRN